MSIFHESNSREGWCQNGGGQEMQKILRKRTAKYNRDTLSLADFLRTFPLPELHYQRGEDWGEPEEGRNAKSTPDHFPLEYGGILEWRNFKREFLQQDFISPGFWRRFGPYIQMSYYQMRALVWQPHQNPCCVCSLHCILQDACSLLLHGDKLQYIFIYEMFCALNIKSDRLKSNFCSCWFLPPAITEKQHHPEFYLHNNFSSE